jgi:hypothetical protein
VADKSARAAARKSADIPDEDEGDPAHDQLLNPTLNAPGAPGSNGAPAAPMPGQKPPAQPVEAE